MSSNRLLALSAVLVAATAGFAVALATGATDQLTPQRTVTVNVGTGERGPAGPPGPQGPIGPGGTVPNGFECPAGYTIGDLVINHPGGQTTILTCLKD